jgi:HD-GYP domain-containing protein (c-di-GMP phosphodiesterase class II)
METHPVTGERMLAAVEGWGEIARIVRHHHERWDGQGYPDGLSGEEIPLISRIIAVADEYSYMTSDRPHRDAMPSRVARLNLAQGIMTQFDAAPVAAFEVVLATSEEDYRLASREDFTLAATEYRTPGG